MSLFKKSTGMTLNEYVNLLRLSYAQALLMQEDANVLSVAMESGLRLAQRLQQDVPQDGRHVAVRFPQGVGAQVAALTHVARCAARRRYGQPQEPLTISEGLRRTVRGARPEFLMRSTSMVAASSPIRFTG